MSTEDRLPRKPTVLLVQDHQQPTVAAPCMGRLNDQGGEAHICKTVLGKVLARPIRHAVVWEKQPIGVRPHNLTIDALCDVLTLTEGNQPCISG